MKGFSCSLGHSAKSSRGLGSHTLLKFKYVLFVAVVFDLGLITLSKISLNNLVDSNSGSSIKATQQSNLTENNNWKAYSPELERTKNVEVKQQSAPINLTKTSSQYSLNPRQNWINYRLGDGVKGYDRISSDKGLVCKTFPGTILCEYLQRTAKKGDVSILLDIVRDWSADKWKFLEKPGVKSIVMHLRLGDGLCRCHDDRWPCKASNKTSPSCWENEGNCYHNSAGALYAYPREYYELVAADLLESVGRNSTIIIVADPSHNAGWGGNKYKCAISIDMAYRDDVRSFFQLKGFRTQIYELTGIPDYDFVYMSLARYFVRGGGGYSNYVAKVVTAGGGKVFEPRIMSDN